MSCKEQESPTRFHPSDAQTLLVSFSKMWLCCETVASVTGMIELALALLCVVKDVKAGSWAKLPD